MERRGSWESCCDQVNSKRDFLDFNANFAIDLNDSAEVSLDLLYAMLHQQFFYTH